jgi:hypothetical protein
LTGTGKSSFVLYLNANHCLFGKITTFERCTGHGLYARVKQTTPFQNSVAIVDTINAKLDTGLRVRSPRGLVSGYGRARCL